LQLIQNDLRLSGLMPLLGSGVVLTGGASQLEGLIEMGEFVLDIPVRRGTAIHSQSNLGGITDVVKPASFATAVGILKYAMAKKKYTKATSVQEDALGESINSVGKKIKTFFEQMF
jgi:cell division protein FtsA